jgi:hypothetical protein
MVEYISLLIGFVLVVACFLWIMYYLVFTDKFEQQLQKRIVDKIGKKDEK